MEPTLTLRVRRIEDVALDVRSFELVAADDTGLPAFEAGAHIELRLPDGLRRSYSLLNAPDETDRYVIAVHRAPASAGGSRYLHETVREGMLLACSTPRNQFPLVETAAGTALIAGGIGITPLLAMVRRLAAIGRPWSLHYCARTPAHAAFVDEARALARDSGGELHLYFDQVPQGRALDIAGLVGRLPESTHLYCCGPGGMLRSFEAATDHCRDRRHLEYFGAREAAARTGGFIVELARSGLSLEVAAGRSILDVVLDAGIDVPMSCREGLCGRCETPILAGEADHRDALLTEEERAANRSLMICCSGAKGAKLVLDL